MISQLRVGMGYDVHKLVKGRPLVLGGVTIAFEKGLLGHSDADVLTHSACDALLGAAALGDLGRHFPDNTPEFKDIYSIELLRRCHRMITGKGYSLVNLDATVFAQAPKIATYNDPIRQNIADCLEVAPSMINVKATTTEGLGYIGHGEGMAAMCVVMIKSCKKTN
ncbi:MAG: 2-C-methyl-D-erythritol 2,4-cyclodiphosphate synthase [Desulfobacteraceae bacterium]|nr:2-C-methyl-D-erythritol 2,4-cyclodiphosphate synthase [Desulfobacteraceae bacterium]